MWTMMLAAAFLVQPADSVTVTGVVVDPAGKPASDVEVVLAARRPADESVPTLARSMTDAHGAFRLELDRQRLQGIGPIRVIWAYRPGRLAATELADFTGNEAIPPVRLTLAEPWKRTVTILDHQDRPLGGIRLVPVLSRGKSFLFTPDDWLERLTVATGPDGVATLPYLPVTVDPLLLRVTTPGIAPHNLPILSRPGNDRVTLKLGRPARLAGSVFNDSGQPAANVVVEVWMENTFDRSGDPDRNQKVTLSLSLIHFDSGPIRTGADGSFVTPPQLLTGSSYRIIVRPEGEPPVSSDSMTAAAEPTTVPPLRLQQRRKLVGVVHDRHGQPVAGARVFLPSGELSTTTDAQGRFLLEGILPERTYILVQAEGFRFQGWPAIPARQPQERKLTLVRSSEPPDRAMAALPAPTAPEESRALARRVLEPYLQAVLAKGDDGSRLDCLRTLSAIDPARMFELLGKEPLQNLRFADSLRIKGAIGLLATDPVEAESIVNATTGPGDRALGYVRLAEALPAAERDRKRELLERATVQVHAPAGGGRGVEPQNRLFMLARVAEGWLDLGAVEKARPLIREGFELLAALPPARRNQKPFLTTAARLEPDRVLSLIRDDGSPSRRQSSYVAVAEALANEHPAEAERVFQLIDDSSRIAHEDKAQVALRICRRLAKTDPDRARRIIAGLKEPRVQACGWALLAFVLADRDKPAARSALNESIQLIDRLIDPGGAAGRTTAGRTPPLMLVVADPAASILPIVEIVAPERLEEVFWKALALMPNDETARARGVADRRLAVAAIFLARYDRQVADVLVTKAMASRSRSQIRYYWTDVRARASVDPRGAVAMIEAMPPDGPGPRHPTDEARSELATCLAEPIEEHWKFVWSLSGTPVDGRIFP